MKRKPVPDAVLESALRLRPPRSRALPDARRLRREHPEETPEQIQARLRRWLHERPGAENGDTVGRLRPGFGEDES